MSKVIGLKLTDKDKKLIRHIEDSGLSHSELLRKALNHYFEAVNHDHKEKKSQKVNQTVNHNQREKQEKPVNQVNQKVNHVQVTENHELIEYLKRDNEWLKDRIEHFENTQDKIFTKIDVKPKKETSMSWVRM